MTNLSESIIDIERATDAIRWADLPWNNQPIRRDRISRARRSFFWFFSEETVDAVHQKVEAARREKEKKRGGELTNKQINTWEGPIGKWDNCETTRAPLPLSSLLLLVPLIESHERRVWIDRSIARTRVVATFQLLGFSILLYTWSAASFSSRERDFLLSLSTRIQHQINSLSLSCAVCCV